MDRDSKQKPTGGDDFLAREADRAGTVKIPLKQCDE
jgi:hypothetical protein